MNGNALRDSLLTRGALINFKRAERLLIYKSLGIFLIAISRALRRCICRRRKNARRQKHSERVDATNFGAAQSTVGAIDFARHAVRQVFVWMALIAD